MSAAPNADGGAVYDRDLRELFDPDLAGVQ
jgi:hypothetical protein